MASDDRPEEGLLSGFPQSPSSLDADPRVSFSKLDNKFILETDEGNEFEWDTALKRWIPVVGKRNEPLPTDTLSPLSTSQLLLNRGVSSEV